MAKSRISKLVYYDRTERRVVSGYEMRSVMQRLVDGIADDARPDAPRADGAGHAQGRHGADLIQGEVVAVAGGWLGRVGWPRPAYYLYMHEKGWKFKSARPFLRPAATRRREL